jgi:hypothetical protein
MSFGNQTVTFVSYSDTGTMGALGTYQQAETLTVAPGCRHRTLSAKETAEYDVDVATVVWKTTVPVGEYSAPVRAAVLGAEANGEIRVDGESFKIIGGPRDHPDFVNPFKVTILSQKQTS